VQPPDASKTQARPEEIWTSFSLKKEFQRASAKRRSGKKSLPTSLDLDLADSWIEPDSTLLMMNGVAAFLEFPGGRGMDYLHNGHPVLM
jgi:hypothetical protein